MTLVVALAALAASTGQHPAPRCAVLKQSAQPKSGTTWLGQLLYSLGEAACDDERRCQAKRHSRRMRIVGRHLDMRIEPRLEKHDVPGVGDEKFGYHGALFPIDPPREKVNAKRLDELAATLQEEKTCIFFMFRDPRDVVVSACHHGGKPCNLQSFWRKHMAATAEWISLRYAVFAHLEARGAPVSAVFFEDLKRNFTGTAATIAAAAGLPVPARLLPRVQEETSLKALRDLAADGHLGGGETKVRKGHDCGFLSADGLTPEDISWANQFMDALPSALRRKFNCGDEAMAPARAVSLAFMSAKRGRTEEATSQATFSGRPLRREGESAGRAPWLREATASDHAMSETY